MKIGFTGTRNGLTKYQLNKLRSVLSEQNIEQFHHGDCIGADKEAHNIIRELDKNITIIIHPPLYNSKRAYCSGDEVRPRLDYLDRNKQIVDETELLIACPETMFEITRSGTWSTVRHASMRNRDLIIIRPIGKRREVNG